MKKRYVRFLLCLTLAATCFLYGCSATQQTSAQSEESTTTSSTASSTVTYDEYDMDEDYHDEVQETITLSQQDISYTGEHATVSGNMITITSAGTFVVSGSASDVQIVVDAAKTDMVRIVLDNVDMTCTSSSPIYVKQADKVVITLAENSKNIISDTDNYVLAVGEDEPDAALFAKDDLTINGSGSLMVNGNYKNGIKGKDDVKIMNGTIQVEAVDNGIVGKDIMAIHHGSIDIHAGGDGIKATNATESDKGILQIDDGTITIDAQQDGMQSDNAVYINGGTLTITSAGGSTQAETKTSGEMGGSFLGGKMKQGDTTTQPVASADTDTTEDEISIKGVKAEQSLIINDGLIQLDCNGNGLHSNNEIRIQGGEITIASGNKGIHADQQFEQYAGTITITTCYEGIESETITLHDGSVHISASDDGINASIETTTDTDTAANRPSGGGDASSITIHGGYVYIDADGDGLDSNGNISMHGGMMIVNGSTSSGNGALDFDGSFDIDGGTLLASGSSGMLQTPTTISNGYCVTIGVDVQADTLVHIQDEDGTGIMTFAPSKASQSIVYYSSTFADTTTYQVYTQGSAENGKDGVFDSSTYQGGSLYQEFTIESTQTNVGNATQGMNGMSGGRGGMGNKEMPQGTPGDMENNQPPA